MLDLRGLGFTENQIAVYQLRVSKTDQSSSVKTYEPRYQLPKGLENIFFELLTVHLKLTYRKHRR